MENTEKFLQIIKSLVNEAEGYAKQAAASAAKADAAAMNAELAAQQIKRDK